MNPMGRATSPHSLAKPDQPAEHTHTYKQGEFVGFREEIRGRGLARILVLAAMAATLPWASAAPASAQVWNGEVQNDSWHTMHSTIKLNNAKHKDHCDVWNYSGGLARTANWAYVKCAQSQLTSGSHAGGGNTDVDAFTFNYTKYKLYMSGPQATWLDKGTINKGVWTKITDWDTATCTGKKNEVPVCYVS